jgi:hypothetical protein
MHAIRRWWQALCMAGLAALLWPAGALAEDSGWSLGVYGGPYYDTELHHRCAIYDRLNDYGANGEDFVALGWRSRF